MKNLIFTLLLALGILTAQGQDIEVPQVQRAIITKHTATWCTNCGRTAWDVFEKVVAELGTNSIPLAAHRSASSDLYSITAKDFLNNMQGVVYQPEFFVNHDKVSGSSSSLYDNIKNSVLEIESQTPDMQTGLELFIPEDADGPLKIKTRTKFYKELSGQYFLSVWLLEKEMVNYQQSRGSDAVHKQVILKSILPETFGDELFNGNASPAEDIYKDFEYELEEGETLDGKSVMVALWQFVDGRYTYVNSNSSDMVFIESAPTSTNVIPTLVGQFEVTPYDGASQTRISLDIISDINNANIDLYNINGQKVQNIFSGDLNAGQHQFDFSKRPNTGSGSFIISLQSPKGVLSKKIFLKE